MHTKLPLTTAAITLGLLLTSCTTTNDDPTPTPSTPTQSTTPTPEATTPEPTQEPTTPDPKTANIDAAKQTLLDYISAVNDVAADGFTTWHEELPKYWGTPAIANPNSASYEARVEAGEASEGDIVIDSITVTEYVEDPTGAGHEQVRLEYCSDNSAVINYDSAGEVIPRTATPRFLWDVLMQRQDSGRWTINEQTPYVDQVC